MKKNESPVYKIMKECEKRINSIPITKPFSNKCRYNIKALYEEEKIVGFIIDISIKVESHPFKSTFACTTPELDVTKIELGHWMALVERFIVVANSYFTFIS